MQLATLPPDSMSMDQIRAAASLEAIVHTGAAAQVHLSETIGAIRMSRVNEEFSRVARIKMLAEIKDAGAFRGLQIAGPDGSLIEARTWEQFVASLGIGSVDTVDEQIRNLAAFGEQFMESATVMRLGYRDLRRLRKLPDQDRQAVAAAVEAELQDREAVLALIDSLADKHARENRDASDRIAKLERDLQKKTKQVDAIVKAETETLEAERDALVKRVGDLEAIAAGGDWAKASEAAVILSECVKDLCRDAESMLAQMPLAGTPPPRTAAMIAAALFQMLQLSQRAWDLWEDRSESAT